MAKSSLPLSQSYHPCWWCSSLAISRHFLANIWKYNGFFVMTSFGHKEAAVQGWNPSFRIQGQAFHRIGTLLPPAEGQPKFLQVYFLDFHAYELTARNHNSLNPLIFRNLTLWFHDNNHLIQGQRKIILLKVASMKRERSSSGKTRGHRGNMPVATMLSQHQKWPSWWTMSQRNPKTFSSGFEMVNPRELVSCMHPMIHSSIQSSSPMVQMDLQARTATGQDGGCKIT